MSETTSPATSRRYGTQRVCEIWDVSRSGYYASQKGREPAGQRGPKPLISDEMLLAAIKADLRDSPFSGEGHRKVWARLRFVRKLRIGRNRVLRLMREHHLLSPYRPQSAEKHEHDGTIGTDAPYMMWGTDGTKIFTLDEGWVWCFAAVEHFNAECMGWHVVKYGDRFEAVQPIAQAVTTHYGSVAAGVARGLSLRFDHGSQYTSDHFQNQIKFWGIKPSPAFVNEPETNGVAERFFRTLKEQAIYGRAFRNVDELRQAIGRFVELYNHQWRIEKRGFQTPVEARKNWYLKAAA